MKAWVFLLISAILPQARAQLFNATVWHNPVPLTAANAPQSGSLVGLWHFDTDYSATVGSTMSQISGSPAVASNPEVGAGCLSLNGTTWIATPNSSTYAFANTTFTVVYWIKTTGGNYWIVSNGGGSNGTGHGGWTTGITNTGLPYIFIKDGSNNQMASTGGKVSNDGKWHQLAWVITTDTTTQTNNTVTSYVDGANPVSTVTYGSFTKYDSPLASYALGIGNRTLGVAGSTGAYVGYVDELAVWSTGLTASEIKQLYLLQALH